MKLEDIEIGGMYQIESEDTTNVLWNGKIIIALRKMTIPEAIAYFKETYDKENNIEDESLIHFKDEVYCYVQEYEMFIPVKVQYLTPTIK